jgi:beta-glucosidase
MINIIRDPRGGRNFETYSEDPYLTARLGVAYVKGVQSQHVIATPKHFICNNQEIGRRGRDITIGERALREIYAPAFKAAVLEAGAWSVMAAYNSVNGAHCTENRHILRDILKQEWGFSGYVVSDWDAARSTAPSALNGLDLEMPSDTWFGAPLLDAVQAGTVPDSVLDNMVRRILRAKYWAGVFDSPIRRDEQYINSPPHSQLALEAGRRSIVLLKNDRGLLPLDADSLGTIAVVGPYADSARINGGGSSYVTPVRSVGPREGIAAKLKPGASLTDNCREADVVVICIGVTGEGEDRDRQSLAIPPAQDRLVDSLLRVNPDCIVVFTGGSAAVEGAWSQAPTVIAALYPGQEMGTALADILFGECAPGGKLPVSFPKTAAELPPYNDTYEPWWEGRGYRYFDIHDLDPLFPFGHGLSYTQFTYSNCRIFPPVVRYGDTLWVQVDIANAGKIAGEEIVQLYLQGSAYGTPYRVTRLRGFSRVALDPGVKKTITFSLNDDDFAYYDTAQSAWRRAAGKYELRIGAASDDIRSTVSVTVE